jgi:hypothetical protein
MDDGAIVVYPPCDGMVVTRNTWLAYHNIRGLSAEGDTPTEAKEKLIEILVTTDLDKQRTYPELKVAHDLLGAAYLGYLPKGIGETEATDIMGTVICWVMGHNRGIKVERSLGELAKRMLEYNPDFVTRASEHEKIDFKRYFDQWIETGKKSLLDEVEVPVDGIASMPPSIRDKILDIIRMVDPQAADEILDILGEEPQESEEVPDWLQGFDLFDEGDESDEQE